MNTRFPVVVLLLLNTGSCSLALKLMGKVQSVVVDSVEVGSGVVDEKILK